MNSKDIICIVSAVFPPEPVVSAKLSLDIATELSKSFKVIVITPKPTRPFGINNLDLFVNNNIFEHHYIENYTSPKPSIIGRLYESYSLGTSVIGFIEKNKINIRAIYLNVWPVFSQGLIVKWAKSNGVKTILHVQDIYPESITAKMPYLLGLPVNYFFRKYDKHVMQNASKIIAISNNMKAYLSESRHIEPEKIEVVRNWQSEVRNIETLNSKKERNAIFTFMYLGSINKSSGLDFIIKCFGGLNLSNTRLVIAGNGSEKENCMDLANSYPTSKIEFWDASPDYVYKLQADADVMILPLKKGIGLTATPSKLLAYLFSAKPILACVESISDTANIIVKSQSGWVTPPEDINELKKSILNIVKIDFDVLKEMGIKGYKYANINLSKDVSLKGIVKIISKIQSAS
ncbi:MAG: glycosyltransferase family 4 protein [Bacteroidota bacterium]|nr:glycosyltransferase family 4 protein [Bacteroidota bacterium]